jgi:aminopeptidase N
MKQNTLKKLTFTLFILLAGLTHAQKPDILRHQYDLEFQTFKDFVAKNATFKGDTNIDVRFYYINISIGVESPYVDGSVLCRFEPLVNGLNSLTLNLNQSLTVDSISAPCNSYSQTGNEILIELSGSYNPGELIDLTIYYHGVPVLAGGYKGLRYESHGNNEPVIATLSTPYLAHYWYPCKDGPEDKPDSVYMDITIPNLTYNGIDITAVSNGVLDNIIDNGDTKTFQWRHRYPVVTYYVMAAISNYVHFQDEFNGTGGESYPLDYYVFNEDLSSAQQGTEDMPEVLQFFSDIFGTYPFSNEKYGMTQLGFYGAIENQTNTITNNMSPSWFLISAHELAHQWFGDMITCENWHHAWLNEGFATYSESLWTEHLNGYQAYLNYIHNEEYFNGGTLYLENAQDTFNIFQSIIYKKGAYTLHMLRGVVGDELFFEGLMNYATNPGFMYGEATTEDLQQVFEETSGIDLDFFFEEWVYDEYYPFYMNNWVQNEDNSAAVVIKQVQDNWGYRPVFEMPVRIRFDLLSGADTTIIVWNDQQLQQYSFDLPEQLLNVNIDPEKWILRKEEYSPDIPVGISDDESGKGIIVSPNPFQSRLIIDIPNGKENSYRFTMFDVNGKTVSNTTIIPGKRTEIALKNTGNGIYFYRITGGTGKVIKTGKILKR